MLSNITVTDITEIFTVVSPKGRFEKIENRKCYGLSFCDEGQITYTHNNNKFISDKFHAIILPKGQSYTLYGNRTGTFPVINFLCSEFLCDTIISLPIDNKEAYIKDFERIRSLSLLDTNRAEIMSIFYHILHLLSAHNSYNKIIVPAIKHIENNYQNPELTNTELAKKCNVSEIYFRRIFESCYNMTPKQFIIDMRINKAIPFVHILLHMN